MEIIIGGLGIVAVTVGLALVIKDWRELRSRNEVVEQ